MWNSLPSISQRPKKNFSIPRPLKKKNEPMFPHNYWNTNLMGKHSLQMTGYIENRFLIHLTGNQLFPGKEKQMIICLHCIHAWRKKTSPKLCTSLSTNTKKSTTISALTITVVLMKQNKAEKVYFVMSVTSANNNFKALMNN